MEKAYKFLLLFVLMALGATGVKAERISLQEVPFCSWDGWGANAMSTGTADCAWVVGEATGQPYGDTKVIDYADLTNYSKLYVLVAKGEDGNGLGTPRFLFNRDVDEGQYNADESQSHLLEYPKSGWTDRYFSTESSDEGIMYIVDVKQIAKDKGFCHLHAIKGANWANVTVLSMEVERQGKAQQIGWTSIINNGNMEGDDVSSFPVAQNAVQVAGTQDATIEDGAGVDGSRGLVLETLAGATEDWATQLFVKFNESLPEGTKWRFTMDVKADNAATVGSGCHGEPRAWIAGGIINEFTVSDQWTTVTGEGTIGSDLADKLGSIAFDLNRDRETANKFYFDNINFEVYKYGTTAEYSNDVVLVDFGFDTNIPDLVKASGKPRLMYPNECVAVKINGEAATIYSVEAFEDGRFYIFLDNATSEGDEVLVSFTNPTDEALHIIYTSGPGGDANSFVDVVADHNAEIEDNEGYPYDYLTPVVLTADPEDGSFNLPNSIKEFKLTFDKDVDCAALVATMNGQALAVTPATDYATEITLTRDGDADLPTGEYVINVTKIYPKLRLADEVYGDTTYTINIGKVEYDPEDQPKEMIPETYFANCAANSIPEGYIVYFGDETRVGPATYGSGSRMFDFAAGGDFTKGLYFRDKYTEYGTMEGYALPLEAGKKYNIRFYSAAWKDNGMNMKFQVLNEADEVVLEQLVANAPNVNGSTSAVNGATLTDLKFYPAADGNYKLRWYPCSDGNGTEGSFNEVLLGNVKVTYQPNQIGFEETQMLLTALESAKSTRDANMDERYDGEAFSTLVAAIEKYEAEKDGYTSPSQYKNATAALDAASQAMKDHRQLCDNYDEQIKKAIDVVRQNEAPEGNPENATKFVTTELFGQLKETVGKYHGTSEWKDLADYEANPEAEPQWQLFYSFDVLKEDAALTDAVKELSDIANITSLLFTEGKSTPDGSDGGKGTGVAVLIERLRLGAEGLKSLGVDDELVAAANKALTDDDALADRIKNRIKSTVYGQLKNADNTLFEGVVDETTLETVTPTYDVTVFVKNPNIYKLEPNMNFTDESVPGWTVPEGYNRPGLSVGWGQPKNTEGIAEDCMFQTWGSAYRVEQTITDLPAGVYTISYGFTERNSEEEALEGSFMYAKTSKHEEWEDGETRDVVSIGQAFPFAYQNKYLIEGVEVTDGKLTIGANAGSASHTFFNDVRIYMTGAAAGFDYASAYEEILAGIENVTAKNNTVKAVEFFDLNGRRVANSQKGLLIMKRHMADGTVNVQKVVRK